MEDIFVPAAGMAMEDVLLTEWLKQPGEEVAAGEPVAVVETDKATVELSPEGAGRLGRHLFEAGQRVEAGATVARLLSAGEVEPAGDTAATSNGAGTSVPTDTGPTDAEPPPPAPAPPVEPATPAEAPAGPARRTPNLLSPRQRRAQAQTAPSQTRSFADRERPSQVDRTDDGFRQAIANAVVSSWTTIPHFSVGRDVDGEALLAALDRARLSAPATTVTDYLIMALAVAVAELGQPDHIGLAVATDAGVIIPVLRSVTGRSVEDITSMRRDAVERARTRKLANTDSTVPFATLSNLGAMGVDWFTGVIPLGQTALITTGALTPRPVVEGRGIAIKATCSVTVTADHRRYDGADSARLLGLFARAVENIEEGAQR